MELSKASRRRSKANAPCAFRPKNQRGHDPFFFGARSLIRRQNSEGLATDGLEQNQRRQHVETSRTINDDEPAALCAGGDGL
jgi:hypothetical protein